MLPWCEKHGVAVVGYSPFGHGRFPGPAHEGRPGAPARSPRRTAPPRARSRCAFLVRRPSLFTIPKAGQPEHVAENAGAGSLRLTAAELARIERAFPRGRRPRALPTL